MSMPTAVLSALTSSAIEASASDMVLPLRLLRVMDNSIPFAVIIMESLKYCLQTGLETWICSLEGRYKSTVFPYFSFNAL